MSLNFPKAEPVDLRAVYDVLSTAERLTAAIAGVVSPVPYEARELARMLRTADVRVDKRHLTVAAVEKACRALQRRGVLFGLRGSDHVVAAPLWAPWLTLEARQVDLLERLGPRFRRTAVPTTGTSGSSKRGCAGVALDPRAGKSFAAAGRQAAAMHGQLGTHTLTTLVPAAVPVWEFGLKALEQFAYDTSTTAPRRDKSGARAGQIRLVWDLPDVVHTGEYLAVTPREQRGYRNGTWSKGRARTLRWLATAADTANGTFPHGARSRGRGGSGAAGRGHGQAGSG